ncbi:MAG: hypothetical protein ACFCVD_25360 [Nodosilinea sp.]
MSLATAGYAQTAGLTGERAQAPNTPAVRPEGVFHEVAGRYSVSVPLDTQADTPVTQVGGQPLTWTVAIARQGGRVYGVAYSDLPPELLGMGGEAVVESLRSRPFFTDFDWDALANRGQRVSLGDLPGIEFTQVEAGKASAARFYLANRRLYAVVAMAPIHEANQFIESFAIDDLWRPFVSEAGQFSVDLPMAPVFTPQQVAYQGATLNWWQYMGYNLYAPGDRYGFAYADLPDALADDLARQNPDRLLQEVATLVLTELDAPATTGTAISLAGLPGREYALTKANGQSYVLRLYLNDRRIYGLLATSTSLNHLDRFLTSFSVQ